MKMVSIYRLATAVIFFASGSVFAGNANMANKSVEAAAEAATVEVQAAEAATAPATSTSTAPADKKICVDEGGMQVVCPTDMEKQPSKE